MMQVRLRKEAEEDLENAARWYEDQRPGLGGDFLDEARHAFGVIAEHSEMYPVVAPNTRRALVRRFPYGVYYRVEQEAVVVIAVMRGSREPEHWRKRT